MTAPDVPLPAQGSASWMDWATEQEDASDQLRGLSIEGVKVHDGTTSGGTRPTGYTRIRWIGGTTRPTNMAAGDIWEHDA